jgi:hypothetical protein
MRKVKDPVPEPDPGGPKTCRSGSLTLMETLFCGTGEKQAGELGYPGSAVADARSECAAAGLRQGEEEAHGLERGARETVEVHHAGRQPQVNVLGG